VANSDEPLPQLTTMRIIAGALLSGVTIFLAIVLYLVLVENDGHGLNPPVDLPFLSVASLVLLLMEAPLSFIVPANITRKAVQQIAQGTWLGPQGTDPSAFPTDAAKLLAVYQTAMIVGLAMLEGAAFFGCIAYLVEGHAVGLGVVILAVLLQILRFPTESRVRAWLEQQAEMLAQLRP
jgi:hypothetical protein